MIYENRSRRRICEFDENPAKRRFHHLLRASKLCGYRSAFGAITAVVSAPNVFLTVFRVSLTADSQELHSPDDHAPRRRYPHGEETIRLIPPRDSKAKTRHLADPEDRRAFLAEQIPSVLAERLHDPVDRLVQVFVYLALALNL